MSSNGQSDAPPSHELRDRVCLITGATSGIGLVTAEELARRGATVVLVARNAQRAENEVQRIRHVTSNPRVNFILADLSSLASVRALADTFLAGYTSLHVLINNAGALFLRRTASIDGYETTFAVNHLAPFLLTNLLLRSLQASAPSRVVNVSSAAHERAQIDFDDLMYERRRYSAMGAYGQSKLAALLFTYELSRRLDGTRVTANALHPGFVATGFARNNGPVVSAAMTLLSPLALSPERGAQTTLYLASSPEVANVSGKYFTKCRPVSSNAASYDTAAQRRLWEISERLTHLATAAPTA